MIVVLTVIVALLALCVIGLQKNLQDQIDELTRLHDSSVKVIDWHQIQINKLNLAQQEQLDRIVNLTAATTKNHNNLKQWTYKNVNDIWYAIENPMTGSEDEPEEVRS